MKGYLIKLIGLVILVVGVGIILGLSGCKMTGLRLDSIDTQPEINIYEVEVPIISVE